MLMLKSAQDRAALSVDWMNRSRHVVRCTAGAVLCQVRTAHVHVQTRSATHAYRATVNGEHSVEQAVGMRHARLRENDRQTGFA